MEWTIFSHFRGHECSKGEDGMWKSEIFASLLTLTSIVEMWQGHDEENSNGHAKWSKNRMHAAIPSEFGQFALEAVLSSPFYDSFQHFVCSYSWKCFPEILTESS